MNMVRTKTVARRDDEQGYMLVGLIVAIFLILLVLGTAAPKVARSLRREREVEAEHRANQYVRAIQLYYRKFGHYPGSMDQLEKSNNIRFLRQQYIDPLTGKADWRLIKVGENKTTVKGFFGQPLSGLTPGLGTAAGMASQGAIGAGAAGSSASSSSTSAFGSPSSGSGGLGSSSGTGSSPSAFGASSGGTGATTTGSSGSAFGSNTGGAFGSSTGTGSSGSSGGIGSQSATSFTGGGAPFMGVGSSKTGDSIVEPNEQTTYQTWEFLYDPRIEQLKAKASLLGGAPTAAGSSGLGSATGNISPGMGGAPGTTSPGTTTTTPGTTTTPSTPPASSFPQ
jgi:type II secretory pathway pseudopilin PulG